MGQPRFRLAVAASLALAGHAGATDIPIGGWKLTIIDKLATAGIARTVFTSKDPSVGVGSGTDPSQIEATFTVKYDSTSGTYLMPAGSNWLRNEIRFAKYANRFAPSGGAVKLSIIRTDQILKVAARSLGDVPIDISTPPSGSVHVAYTLDNAGIVTRYCSQFADCTHSVIPGGGSKLVCRHGGDDPSCAAAVP